MGERVVNAPVITVPAFAPARGEVHHFFGTRWHSAGCNVQVGAPVPTTSIEGAAHASWMLSVKQVHGTDALVVDRALTQSDRFLDGWDALVTDQPGVMVAVRTADCVPVLMHDPQRRVVAAVHAGWRGAVAGIVQKTLALMESRFGSVSEELRVSIGPSAGVCCYEVDEPVLERLHQACPNSEQVVRARGRGKAHLDLKLLIREQARAAGVRPDSITSVNVCTICHEDLFFSYRREGKVIGTMVSAIGLVPL
ncbi:MAG: peptidoglycan editing factor PgeF [Nitrospira sp.]|nr:peptidoglycan editing factor PgeF [Nitrospira sp.]MDH5252089.1 peptidoglycan editing factor PgeF [Nitrospira sp.]